MGARILVVGNEPDTGAALLERLRWEGYAPLAVGDGEKALHALCSDPPSLVLLGAGQPAADGLAVLRALRARADVPVVMLAPPPMAEEDRVLGLELGADDCICEPFSAREVVARVRAVLRRRRPAMGGGGLALHRAQWRATLDGNPLPLTRKEFLLLSALAAHPGQVFSRAQLIETVCAQPPQPTERAIDSHIKNLRRKLVAAGGRGEWIASVYGVGFRFEAP